MKMNERAINTLDAMKKQFLGETRDILDIAIQSLEEIQQYRAIGTVEEIKAAMKYMEIAKMHGTVGKAIDACAEYETIGTVEEFKALKEYKAKMEMQYLDDMDNPLEPLKLSSALQSEIFKYNYRKEHKPQDINILDYTVICALKHCLEEQMQET